MKRSVFHRVLAGLMCLCLLGGILPMSALADDSIRIELENVVTAQHVAAGLVETRTGADWSGGGFAFMNAAGVDGTGNSMTFTLTVPSAGDYTLSITDRDSADRGIFRADFNGEEVATVDFYAASAGFVTHPLGTVTFSSTTGTLTLTCVGANPASNKKYGLAADYVTLTPVEGADASGTCGDNLTWNYNSSTKTLTISGTGAMADYTLFTRAPWNTYHSSITTVTISNSVTSIGDYAFYNCTGMTSVTIPDSVTRIGNSAFYYCTKLTSITIPDSVTSIGNYAFYNCTKLTSITIPDSVTSMGSGAFDSCSNVTIYATTDSVASQYASQKGHRFVAVIFLEGQACYPSWTVDISPTCTEPGSQSHHSVFENEPYGSVVIPATGHAWQLSDHKDATCTENGYDDYVCANDPTHTKRETIPATGHTYSTEWTVDVAPTCEQLGSKSHHCENCDAVIDVTEIPVLGHDWQLSGHKDATCTEDGYDDYVCANDSTHTKREIITATGHTYSTEWTVDAAPTCEQPGSKSHHCGNCDAVIDVTEIPATGHDWQLSDHKDATCTENGYDDYVCANDPTHTKRETIPATGHNWKAVGRMAATCTEDGYVDYECVNDPT
ncbi:MAG: leucine-rich repeat protein, partial [Acutalibacteraceae bacterium]